MEIKQPPVGIKPRWLHDKHRATEIMEAMVRFLNNDNYCDKIPDDWINELWELLDYINEHRASAAGE